ncbi:MAG: Perchlorate reductase subunit alpha [Pseudomonadales bacterium]|nr:Perchlorate reductase subunit alpha [Pseudomonadales bacterium]
MQSIHATRRAFLRGTAIGALGLALDLKTLRPVFADARLPPEAREYTGYRDVYRRKWSWDRIGVGTHSCTNCASGGCSWNLYVRDGIVWREEQGAPYTQTNASVPDYNPRGCQKGASASALYRSPARIRYPLKRVGARGENRWKRISWDEAFDEIAAQLVDTLSTRGGVGGYCENGNNSDFGPSWIAMVRFFNQLGMPITENFASTGDLMTGATLVLGNPVPGGSSDDWFRSDYFVNWFGNPMSTRIPDAHFITEMRYRGGKYVSVTPDFNPSAIHTDLWIGVRPGTDAALALAACRVIIDEDLHDVPYIIEQTDLPLLIREDTRQFLRESDVIEGGRRECFAWWDGRKRAVVWSASSAQFEQDKRTLKLGPDDQVELEPRNARVTLLSGETVKLSSAFTLLRRNLEDYDANSAARITGVHANVIRRFAREFANAKAAKIYMGAAAGKILHGELVQRATILMCALTGNNGRVGGGWEEMTFWELDGKILSAFHDFPSDLVPGDMNTIYPALMGMGAQQAASPAFISGSLLMLLNGGTYAEQLNPAYNDPTLRRTPEEFLKEGIAKGELHNVPGEELGSPDVIFNMFGNPFRHRRMGERLGRTLFAKARLVVDLTLRMDDTARHSDILLPTAGPYEKLGFKYSVSYPPYLHLADKAVEPLGEAKSDWEILSLLMQRVEAEARRRGVRTVKTYRGVEYDLSQAYWRFSDKGRIGPHEDEKFMRLILALSPATQGITMEELRANKGVMRYTGVSQMGKMWCGTSDYRPDEPLVPYQDYVVRKMPWPTSTGRQQFYVDHAIYVEVGETLPVHKQPPRSGGDFPLVMTCGHTRWSVHTLWRDVDILLRLQRGEPVIFVNPDDAARRGLADHDYAAVHNDLGEFVARVKLTPGMQPGQVHIFHAWLATQHVGGRASDAITPSPTRVTNFAGKHGHMVNEVGWFDLSGNDRDTRVDLRKYTA